MIGRGRDSAPRHGIRSPQGFGAGVLLIGLLILIGVLVLGTAGSGRHIPTTTAAPQVATTSAALRRADSALRADQSTVASLRGSLATEQATISHLRIALFTTSARLTAASGGLKAAQANARCWHRKFKHPFKTHALHCAPPGP